MKKQLEYRAYGFAAMKGVPGAPVRVPIIKKFLTQYMIIFGSPGAQITSFMINGIERFNRTFNVADYQPKVYQLQELCMAFTPPWRLRENPTWFTDWAIKSPPLGSMPCTLPLMSSGDVVQFVFRGNMHGFFLIGVSDVNTPGVVIKEVPQVSDITHHPDSPSAPLMSFAPLDDEEWLKLF